MRKLIDIPDDLVKDLRILAAYSDKNVKTYLQDLIIQHIQNSKSHHLKGKSIEILTRSEHLKRHKKK